MRDAALDTSRQSGRGGARIRASGAPSLDGAADDRPASRVQKAGAPRVGGVLTSAAVAAQRLGGRRAGPASARGGRPSPGPLARLRGRLPRIRPFKALAVGVFSVALAGIVTNAMMFQRGHHPAPLFGFGRSVEGAPDGPQQASEPASPAAPIERTGTIAPPAAVEAAPTIVPPAPPPSHAAAQRREDGIAGLITGETHPAAGHPRPGHAARASAPGAAAHPKPAVKLAAKPDPKPRHAAAEPTPKKATETR